MTRLELLHPEEHDVDLASSSHGDLIHFLFQMLLVARQRLPEAVLLTDVDLIWDDPDQTKHRPDLCLIFGVRRQNWDSFDVGKAGVRPTLIVEVTSAATHQNDRQDKLLKPPHAARWKSNSRRCWLA